jgi:hypothetical protein
MLSVAFNCYADCHMLNVVTLGFTIQNFVIPCHYAECCYTECRYAECCHTKHRYAECCYTKCHYTESNCTVLNVLILGVVMPNVGMLSVVARSDEKTENPANSKLL